MSECTIHCWSSSNPDKQCPACLKNEQTVGKLQARIAVLENVIERLTHFAETIVHSPYPTIAEGIANATYILETIKESEVPGE